MWVTQIRRRKLEQTRLLRLAGSWLNFILQKKFLKSHALQNDRVSCHWFNLCTLYCAVSIWNSSWGDVFGKKPHEKATETHTGMNMLRYSTACLFISSTRHGAFSLLDREHNKLPSHTLDVELINKEWLCEFHHMLIRGWKYSPLCVCVCALEISYEHTCMNAI